MSSRLSPSSSVVSAPATLKAAVGDATVTKGLSIRGTAARSSDKQIENFVKGQK